MAQHALWILSVGVLTLAAPEGVLKLFFTKRVYLCSFLKQLPPFTESCKRGQLFILAVLIHPNSLILVGS